MTPRHGLAALLVWLLLVPAIAADEGWVIDRLQIQLEIQPDGTLAALEALDVDFRGLSRHGIFRDMAYLFNYDEAHNREYEIDLTSVTSAEGRRHQVQSTTEGALRRFRIGDPNRTISGKETYRIAYRVRGALNGFADHDELYWNATGTWPVRVARASVVVTAPAGAINRVDCFQGLRGSTEHCGARFARDEATYTATRPLVDGEQMTIVAGLRKGAVAEPVPKLVPRPRAMTGRGAPSAEAILFEPKPGFIALMVVGFVAALGGVGALWWRMGRDRQYVALHHTGHAAGPEEPVPVFGARPIAVEFQPPDGIRPGQMGLLVDESADTVDVTATIIDLAVRGYLTITELPKAGWFSGKDWRLDRVKDADAALLEYEKIVLRGLFDITASRKVSELKNKFHDDLSRAKAALYADAVERKWFARNPESIRTIFFVLGVVVVLVGVGLTIVLGTQWGAGLVALPVVSAGVGLAIVSRAMPRRTAAGRDLMRRTLGFARYIRTAETRQQAFAERANIFTEYLPYAIAFKCVDGWARAFKDIDLQAATAGWYAGTTPFTVASFASTVGSFSSSVSSAIASTPGGSGSSGFSGGSSGGGGGGGGGGSW